VFELDSWKKSSYTDIATLEQVTRVAESPSLEVSKTWLTDPPLAEVLS